MAAVKVGILLELDQDEILGQPYPRVTARLGEQTVISYARSYERKDIECEIGAVIARAIERHYRGWGVVREAFEPPKP